MRRAPAPWSRPSTRPSPLARRRSSRPRTTSGPIRRRFWLALTVAIPVATAGTLYVLRMPPVYSVTASIEIKPPKVDPTVASLVTHGEVGRGDAATDEKYVPDTLALLNSKSMLDEVFRDPALGLAAGGAGGRPRRRVRRQDQDPADSRCRTWSTSRSRAGPGPDHQDPRRPPPQVHRSRPTTRAGTAATTRSTTSRRTKTQYIQDLKEIEDDLAAHIRDSNTLAPGGRSLKEAEFDAIRSRLGFHAAAGRQPPERPDRQGDDADRRPRDGPGRAQKIGHAQGRAEAAEEAAGRRPSGSPATRPTPPSSGPRASSGTSRTSWPSSRTSRPPSRASPRPRSPRRSWPTP